MDEGWFVPSSYLVCFQELLAVKESVEKEEKEERDFYREPRQTVRQILFDHHKNRSFSMEDMIHEISGLAVAVS